MAEQNSKEQKYSVRNFRAVFGVSFARSDWSDDRLEHVLGCGVPSFALACMHVYCVKTVALMTKCGLPYCQQPNLN